MSAKTLTAADFPEFFAAVRDGSRPFPWQHRLVEELARSVNEGGRGGRWPALLDLPTGSGKTATIEIAAFLMALRDDAPRRIVFVVDRRVVVQQAAEVARNLACQLRVAEQDDGVLGEVARRLYALSGGVGVSEFEPLATAELRGAIEQDDSWARRPDRPTVIVSTVDQVGSRLLMQGYGVSDSMRPVHAGLFANDALFLLDEVHLSRPFCETLEAVGRMRWSAPGAAGRLPDRWQVVRLSATAGSETLDEPERFELDEADRDSALAVRLSARKPFTTVEVKLRGEPDSQCAQLGGHLAAQARALMTGAQPRVVAVIANRVASAVAAAKSLLRDPGRRGAEVVLLTGRMRPWDRDSFWAFGHRLLANPERAEDPHGLFVVGTQSLEAGADYDFDALVTECASLDALRQRFGRVDRLGRLSASGGAPTSVVVGSAALGKGPKAERDLDPVYGAAVHSTWKWLRKLPNKDFGIESLDLPSGEDLEVLCVEPDHAPALMPSHLDRWSQSPRPHGTPPVAPFLHGLKHGDDAEVQVVWRAGLTGLLTVFSDAVAAGPAGKSSRDTSQEAAKALMQAVPVRVEETVGIPRSMVVRWLAGESVNSVLADVEGIAPEDGRRQDEDAAGGCFLRVRGGEASLEHHPRYVMAGDIVVVPSERGGLTLSTWDPSGSEWVRDLAADLAVVGDAGSRRARAFVRLDPTVLSDCVAATFDGRVADHAEQGAVEGWREFLKDRPPPSPDAFAEDPNEGEKQSCQWLQDATSWLEEHPGLRVTGDAGALGMPDAVWGDPKRTEIIAVNSGSWGIYLALASPSRRRRGSKRRAPGEERDGLTFETGVRQTLDAHLADTARWAGAFAAGLGIEPGVSQDLISAARWHDIGKVDPRFQDWLRDGSVAAGGLLAKSGMDPRDRDRWRLARQRAGYPWGERHEMFSAVLVKGSAASLGATDAELVEHLVAAHHGRSRPFAPVPRDRSESGPGVLDAEILGVHFHHEGPHGMERLDSPAATDFWRVTRRYGWFALAWLNALLRLADHRASEYPSTDAQADADLGAGGDGGSESR